MHFEYPGWTGERARPFEGPPPHPRARSKSFSSANAPWSDSDQNDARNAPRSEPHTGFYPSHTEEYYFNLRDFASMPTWAWPRPPFAYTYMNPSPEQLRYERFRAQQYAYEREPPSRRWAWEHLERMRWAWPPQSEISRSAEWLRREAVRRYEEQRERERRRYFAWRKAADDYEGARRYSEWGRSQSRPEFDEWGYRRPQASRNGGPYTNPNAGPHSHPFHEQGHAQYDGPRFSHWRTPSDSSSTSSKTSFYSASSADAPFETSLKDAFAAYDSSWAMISDSNTPLTFRTVPWPQNPPPHSVEDIDTRAIRAFLGAGPRALKAHTREALLRFHPDKITTLLTRVQAGPERDRVATACSAVTRCLGEALKG